MSVCVGRYLSCDISILICGFLPLCGFVWRIILRVLRDPKVRMACAISQSATSLYNPERHLAIFCRPILVAPFFPGLGLGSTFWLGIGLGVACRSIPMPVWATRCPGDFGAAYRFEIWWGCRKIRPLLQYLRGVHARRVLGRYVDSAANR